MKRNDDSPEAYCNDVQGEQRQMLELIRAMLQKECDEEAIEYGMLAYPGIAHLAAQKHHVSLYVNPEVLARHREQFPGVNCGKSCLRFRHHEEMDVDAIQRLILEAKKHGETC